MRSCEKLPTIGIGIGNFEGNFEGDGQPLVVRRTRLLLPRNGMTPNQSFTFLVYVFGFERLVEFATKSLAMIAFPPGCCEAMLLR